MAEAAGALPGEHDFTAFRASGSDNLNPVRRVLAAEWRRESGGWLIFTVTATGFLRGMVRSLVGTMAAVGRGKAPPTDPGGTAGKRRPAPGRPHGAAPGALSGGSVLWRVSSEHEHSTRAFGPPMKHEKFGEADLRARPRWWDRFSTCAPAPVKYRCHQKLFSFPRAACIRRILAATGRPIKADWQKGSRKINPRGGPPPPSPQKAGAFYGGGQRRFSRVRLP